MIQNVPRWRREEPRALWNRLALSVCGDRVRRVADVVIACALLAISLPLLLIVSAAIRYESPGPILERELCIGRGGRRFRILQFRTILYPADNAMRIPEIG